MEQYVFRAGVSGVLEDEKQARRLRMSDAAAKVEPVPGNPREMPVEPSPAPIPRPAGLASLFAILNDIRLGWGRAGSAARR